MSDVPNDLSSVALINSCRQMSVASFIKSIYPIFGFSLFLLLWFFLTLLSLKKKKILYSHDVSKVRQLYFCHFCFQWCPGLICFRTHLFILLAVRSAHRASLQPRIPSDFFFPIRLLHCPTLAFMHSNRRPMILTLIFNDTSLFFVIFHI